MLCGLEGERLVDELTHHPAFVRTFTLCQIYERPKLRHSSSQRTSAQPVLRPGTRLHLGSSDAASQEVSLGNLTWTLSVTRSGPGQSPPPGLCRASSEISRLHQHNYTPRTSRLSVTRHAQRIQIENRQGNKARAAKKDARTAALVTTHVGLFLINFTFGNCRSFLTLTKPSANL